MSNIDEVLNWLDDEHGGDTDAAAAFGLICDLRDANFKMRRALFMCASHCQGGHSEVGRVAAELLGVPFPIRMDALVGKAKAEGVNPDELWPWLKSMSRRVAETEAEAEEAKISKF